MENLLAKKFYQQYLTMIEWVNIYVDMLTDEEYEMELSSGKNHGVWILGHMITSDDDFSYYMGKGNYLFPEYQELFGQASKLRPVKDYPSVSILKEQWKSVCEKNKKIYESLSDYEFEEVPENMTDEMKNYFLSKGKVVMAWQLHQMCHAGQLGILVSRTGRKMS